MNRNTLVLILKKRNHSPYLMRVPVGFKASFGIGFAVTKSRRPAGRPYNSHTI